MPVAEFGRLVVVQAQMNGKLRFANRLGEVEIGRRVVDRVPFENHQQLHLTAVEGVGQLADRRGRIFGPDGDRLDVLHRRADVAKLGVDRVAQRMGRGGQVIADDDQRSASLRFKIGGHFGEPLGVDAARQVGRCGAGDPELPSQGAKELL